MRHDAQRWPQDRPLLIALFQHAPVALGDRGRSTPARPEEVAEELIAWVEETDVDGDNLAYAVMPETFCRFCRSGRARAAEARAL